jgi:hypothetical protein
LKKRNEYPQVITPKMEVAWAQLNEPDYEYKKDTGEFHVRGRPDTDDPAYAKLIETAERVRDEFFEETKAQLTEQKKGALLKKLHKVDVIKEEIDRETGDPTGSMTLRAGMRYHVTVKNGPNAGKEYFFKPDFFNARGIQLKNPPKIGSGSIVKLGLRLIPYMNPKEGEVGVSYNLEGVQIIKLVQGGQRDASYYGFGAEDGDDIEDQAGGFGDEGTGGFEGEDGDADADF